MTHPRRRLLPLVGWLAAAGLAGVAAGGDADLPHLLTLPGEPAWVRYTPGSLDRAAHVQEWLDYLATSASPSRRHPLAVGAFLIDREEWGRAGVGAPYGLPLAAGGGRVVVPAYGDAGTVELWRRLVGGALPTLPGLPLRGTAEEAASLWLSDHLALFEMARQLVPQVGLQPEDERVAELLAHVLVLTAVGRAEPGREAALAKLWDSLAVNAAPSGALPAAEAARLGRQAALFAAAREVVARERGRPMTRLERMQRQGGGVLAAAALAERYPAVAAATAAASP